LNGSKISIIGSKNIQFRLRALPTVELNNKFSNNLKHDQIRSKLGVSAQ